MLSGGTIAIIETAIEQGNESLIREYLKEADQ